MICRICKDEVEDNVEDLCVYCYAALERKRLRKEAKAEKEKKENV